MAETPKRSLKRTVASTVEDRTPRFLLGWLAIAMVISLLAGLGIGMKVEKHRIKPAKKTATGGVVKPKPTGKKPALNAKLLASLPVSGTAGAVTAKTMVVVGPRGRVVLTLVKLSTVEVVTAGAASGLAKGSRVLVALVTTKGATTSAPSSTTAGSTPAGAGTSTAKEIVILPTKSTLGSLVTAVTADSVSVTLPSGKPLTIGTTGTVFDKVATGTRADVTRGKRVVVREFRRGKARPIAREILVLPAKSAFG